MNDLEDDWAMVRAIPPRQGGADESDSLHEDWATLRNLPACLYVVNNHHDWDSVSLWRVRVLGFHGSKREQQWTVQYQATLFGPTPPEGIAERKYTLGVNRATLTLGEAVLALNGIRRQHHQALQAKIQTQEATVREHMATLTRLGEAAEAMPARIVLRGDQVCAVPDLKLPPLPEGDDFANLYGLEP